MSNQTRRSWMVTIGQAAVGLELSGKAQAAVQSANLLPPGLYDPSTDHLSHALMSTGRFHPGCFGLSDGLRPPADRSVQAFIFLCIRIHNHPAFNGTDTW